jgi:hypothetical protein
MKKALLSALALIGLTGCASLTTTEPTPYPDVSQTAPQFTHGELKRRAEGYDRWAQQHWLQPFGGVANTIFFDDPGLSIVQQYGSVSDSAIWTGLYLASQAWRYQVTGTNQSRRNLEQGVEFLSHLKQVTGNNVIARFVAPLRPPFNQADKCKVDLRSPCIELEYQGVDAYWLGATTRDQYSGWFFGMYAAYQSSDDPKLKAKIAADIKDVVLRLHLDDYHIRPPKGASAKVASKPNPIQLLAWLSAAAEVTQDPDITRFHQKLKKKGNLFEQAYAELISFSANKYGSYVGPHLTYLNYYLLIKSAKSDSARQKYIKQFRKINDLYQRDQITLYDYIAMDLLNEAKVGMVNLNKVMLTEFNFAPNQPHPVYPPEAPLNETSVRLYKTNVFLYDEKIFVYPQAKNPYPLQYRCSTAYAWQQSPYQICCTKPEQPWSEYQLHCDNRRTENVTFGGVDYLLAYWMGRAKGFIGKED